VSRQKHLRPTPLLSGQLQPQLPVLQSEIGTITAPTSASSVNYQFADNWDDPPKLMLFFTCGKTASNFSNPPAGISYGVHAASNDYTSGGQLSDNVATTVARHSTDTKLFTSSSDFSLADYNINGVIANSGLITNLDNSGFTVNWTTANSLAIEFYYIAIGGDKLTDAHSNVILVPGTPPATNSYNIGFQPDAIIAIAHTRTPTFAINNWNPSFSFSDGSNTFCSSPFVLHNDTSPMDITGSFRSDRLVSCVGPGGTENLRGELVSIDPDGYTLAWTAPANPNNYACIIALKGPDVSVGRFTPPATTPFSVDTGINPNLALFHGASLPLAGSIASGQADIHFGTTNGTGAEGGSRCISSLNREVSGAIRGLSPRYDNGRIITRQNSAGTGEADKILFSGFNGTEMEFTSADLVGTPNYDVAYMALS